jgi:hypothetical protein
LAALSEEKPLDPILSKVDRWLLYFDLGEEELLLGNEEEAIEYLSKAYSRLPELADYLRKDLPIILSFRLGVAYLRWAETLNCSLQMTPESCIFPIKGIGIHIDKNPSKRAIRQFAEVLLHTEKDSELNLRSRWLLNIAYMTIGLYPDAIPDEYVIPRESFSSGEEFPHFPNIASRLGLDTFSLSGGVSVDDFNNDGNLEAIGARVALVREGRTTLWRRVHTDGSFLSASDSRIHFGLGNQPDHSGIGVVWPNGERVMEDRSH